MAEPDEPTVVLDELIPDRLAVAHVSFAEHMAGDVVLAPETVLDPYVNIGYMSYIDDVPVVEPEPEKKTRGKVKS